MSQSQYGPGLSLFDAKNNILPSGETKGSNSSLTVLRGSGSNSALDHSPFTSFVIYRSYLPNPPSLIDAKYAVLPSGMKVICSSFPGEFMFGPMFFILPHSKCKLSFLLQNPKNAVKKTVNKNIKIFFATMYSFIVKCKNHIFFLNVLIFGTISF